MTNRDRVFTVTQANQDFSEVARSVDQKRAAVIVKDNNPKCIVLDAETNEYMFDLTDDEIIDIVAKRVLQRYLPAFKALAKR